MKRLLLLGLAVLGLSACTPSSNPINDDPIYNPDPNPNNDPKLDSTIYSFNAGNAFVAPRKGGIVEIPVEFEGEYTISSHSSYVQIVRTKAVQKGTIAVSVTPNMGDADRVMDLTIKIRVQRDDHNVPQRTTTFNGEEVH